MPLRTPLRLGILSCALATERVGSPHPGAVVRRASERRRMCGFQARMAAVPGGRYAPERIRTADALLRTEALYPLSYGGWHTDYTDAARIGSTAPPTACSKPAVSVILPRFAAARRWRGSSQEDWRSACLDAERTSPRTAAGIRWRASGPTRKASSGRSSRLACCRNWLHRPRRKRRPPSLGSLGRVPAPRVAVVRLLGATHAWISIVEEASVP